MKLTLGFSPCPNDTFIFDALVNNKIDTQGIDFEVILEDVETLNQLALKNTFDISKISYGVLPLLLNNYMLLSSGGALGKGVGPLLITPHQIPINGDRFSPNRGGSQSVSHIQEYINNCLIVIPGEHTTAHLLFNTAFPSAKNKIFMKYNEIEDFVLRNHSQVSPNGGDLKGAVAGVIIHENRFTYEKKGLKKIMDLGEFWENKTSLPIPLGGIVAKRNIEVAILKKVDALIKESIEFGFSNYPELTGYVKEHSQEMAEDVMRKHIDLYVNNFSIELGNEGRNAIEKFLEIYRKLHPEYHSNNKDIFLD